MLTNLKRKFFKSAFLIIILILTLNSNSYAQQIEVITGPPEGFEELEKPKETVVDVYYNGRFLSAEKAITTPFSIQFSNPNKLFNNLPDIAEEYRNIILRRLSATHSAKLEYSCFPVKKSRCGYLNTDNLAVVYNDEFFVAEIILSSKALVKETAEVGKYLPPPSDKFSEFFRFNSYFFGSDNKRIAGGNTNSYNLNGNSITAFNQLFYNFDVFYTDADQDTNFENIFVAKYLDAYDLKAGTFGVQDLRDIAQPNILGFSFDTTTDRRLDLSVTQANEITVYLDYRSRVLIRKDGRIYHSEIYDQGFQTLDTTKLPLGSYNIDIEIIDPGGISKTETQFFSKRGELPLRDLPYLWFDIGALEELPQRDKTVQRFEKEFLARAGYFKRYFKSVGLGGNLVLNKEVSATEFFAEIYQAYWKANAGFAFTTKTDYVYSFYYQYEKDKWTANLNWRQSFNDTSRYRTNRTYLFKPIASTSKQLSGNARYYILNGRGDIGLFFTYGKSNNQETRSIGPKLRMNVFKNVAGLSGTLEISRFYTDTEEQTLVNFLLNYVKGHWQFNNNTRYDYRKDIDEGSEAYNSTNETWNTNNSLSWQDNNLWDDDLRLTGRYNINDKLTTTEEEIDYKSNYGRLVADSRNNNRTNDYSVDLTTNFAFSQKKFAFGGKDANKSMVVVDLKGADQNAVYDVYINNSPKHRIEVGKRKVFTLTAFEEYSIYLKPREGTNTYIEAKPAKINTYPGSVDFLTYEAKNMAVLLGTLYDVTGTRILSNTEVKGEIGSTITDQYGFFQIDALAGEELTIDDRYFYKIPEKIDETGLLLLDKVIVTTKSNGGQKIIKQDKMILENQKSNKKQKENTQKKNERAKKKSEKEKVKRQKLIAKEMRKHIKQEQKKARFLQKEAEKATQRKKKEAGKKEKDKNKEKREIEREWTRQRKSRFGETN